MVQHWIRDLDMQCTAYVHRNVQVVQREYASPCLGALPDSPATFETMKLLLTEEFQHGIVQMIKEFVPSPDPGTKRYRHAERSPPAPRDDGRGAPPRPAVPRGADRERQEEPAARPAQPPADRERRDEPAARHAQQPPAERPARSRIRRDSGNDMRKYFARLPNDELKSEISSRQQQVDDTRYLLREREHMVDREQISDTDLISIKAIQDELDRQEMELRMARETYWLHEIHRDYQDLTHEKLEGRLSFYMRTVEDEMQQIDVIRQLIKDKSDVKTNEHRLSELKQKKHLHELKISVLRGLIAVKKPRNPSPVPEEVVPEENIDTDPDESDAGAQVHLESMLQTTHRLEDVIPPGTHAGELVEEIDKALLEVKDLWTPLTGITTIQAERVKQALTEVDEYNEDLYTTAVQDFPGQDSGEIRRLSKDLSTESDQLKLDLARALLGGLQATRAQDLWKTSPRLYKAWLHAQRA
jgi:hypothetical protein